MVKDFPAKVKNLLNLIHNNSTRIPRMLRISADNKFIDEGIKSKQTGIIS